MNKEFVTYEEALALKKLGFDEPTFVHYTDNQLIFRLGDSVPWCSMNELELIDWNNCPSTPHCTSAPLYQQAFRWFREKYGLCSWIERMYTADSICYYRYTCEYKKDPSSKTHEVIVSIKEYNTYEEAELACLKKLIEILNQNKDD